MEGLCEEFARADCGVGSASVNNLREGGYEVLHDRIETNNDPAGPAHGVIVLPEVPSMSQHRKMLTHLASHFLLAWP